MYFLTCYITFVRYACPLSSHNTLKYRQSSKGKINVHVPGKGTHHSFHHAHVLWSPRRSMWKLLYNMECNVCTRTYSWNHFVSHTCTKMKWANPSNPPPISDCLIRHYVMQWRHQCLTHLWAFWHPSHFPDLPLILDTSLTHPTLRLPAPLLSQTQRARSNTAECTIQLKLGGTRSWLSGTKEDHAVGANCLDHCIVNF